MLYYLWLHCLYILPFKIFIGGGNPAKWCSSPLSLHREVYNSRRLVCIFVCFLASLDFISVQKQTQASNILPQPMERLRSINMPHNFLWTWGLLNLWIFLKRNFKRNLFLPLNFNLFCHFIALSICQLIWKLHAVQTVLITYFCAAHWICSKCTL